MAAGGWPTRAGQVDRAKLASVVKQTRQGSQVEGSVPTGPVDEQSTGQNVGVTRGRPRGAGFRAGIGRLVRAIRDGDEETVERAVLALSQSRRWLAPLAFLVGAFVMLFDGLKMLIANWRLTLIQVLPAMWIWLAMVDLKAHVFRGKGFDLLNGAALVAAVALITAVTAASFYLNAVFAFAIATPPPPAIRPAFTQVRTHAAIVIGSGALIGLALGISTTVLDRWGTRWFALATGIVIAIMMFCYVAIPARLLGVRTTSGYSRRDKLAATAMGGAVGAVVCTPPYVIGRIGILMLGSSALFIPGLFVVTFGVTLQAGATGSVKALKMSAKIVAGRPQTHYQENSSPDSGIDPAEPRNSARPDL